jgi:hypothetical protein
MLESALLGGRVMSRGMSIVALVAMASALGCSVMPADDLTDRRVRQAAPASSSVPPAPGVPGPLATRQEAQESFDSARAALVRDDYGESARQLAEAAAFMRSHAAQAKIGAIAALQGSAKELEMLAERLTRGEALTTRMLDRVVANANRAEGQHHLTRAAAAIADYDYGDAGEELLMAVDHLERSALDLRRPNEAEADPALSDARALANRMVRGGVPSRDEARHVIGQLEGELRRLCAIIDVEARACAVEAAR